jgi:hypothetical protein
MKTVVPILLIINNTKHKLIYLCFSDDGSIYIQFPRKKGYIISEEITLPEIMAGEERTFTLQQLNKKLYNPYISFHPGKSSIHINTDNNQIYRFDNKILNISEDKNYIVSPICQIIFTGYSYFDVYRKSKYPTPLILNKNDSSRTPLNIEFFIHPIEGSLDLEELPFSKSRKENTRLIGMYTLKNENLKSYTITAVLSELITPFTEDKNGYGIIITIHNDEGQYVYKLKPIN